MHSVRYEAPRSIHDALGLLQADPGATILAGGTDLLIQFRAGVKRPTTFVDVKLIPDLIGIIIDAGGMRIGAATCAAAICEHAELARLWPGVVDAVHLIGSTQIQARGTIGGNLCNGSPAADATCALIVNRAECIIAGAAGERRVAVEHFCVAPHKTVLQRNELLVAVWLPRPAAHTGDAYLRLIPRSEMDIAVASVGVSLTLDADGVCTAARIAIGAVAPTSVVVPEAAAAVIGTRLEDASIAQAVLTATAAAQPIDDKRGTIAYRRRVIGVLTSRALSIAQARAKER